MRSIYSVDTSIPISQFSTPLLNSHLSCFLSACWLLLVSFLAHPSPPGTQQPFPAWPPLLPRAPSSRLHSPLPSLPSIISHVNQLAWESCGGRPFLPTLFPGNTQNTQNKERSLQRPGVGGVVVTGPCLHKAEELWPHRHSMMPGDAQGWSVESHPLPRTVPRRHTGLRCRQRRLLLGVVSAPGWLMLKAACLSLIRSVAGLTPARLTASLSPGKRATEILLQSHPAKQPRYKQETALRAGVARREQGNCSF